MGATTAELVAWCRTLLGLLGCATGVQHVVGPLAWCFAEGGWALNGAAYNPLDTTEPEPGAVPINADGVRSYISLAQGLDATVATLRNGLYPRVLAELAGGTPGGLAAAVGASPWGTPAGTIAGCIPRARAALAAVGAPTGGQPSTSTGGTVQLPTVQAGDAGDVVRSVQALVAGKDGQHIAIDGQFGPETRAAVVAVQTFFHVAVDGVVGPQTWGVLLLA